MIHSFLLVFFLSLSLVLAKESNIDVWATPITDKNSIQFGELKYNNESMEASFNYFPSQHISTSEIYCIGSKKLSDNGCFDLTNFSSEDRPLLDKGFVLYVNEIGEILRVSLINGATETVVVRTRDLGPVPNLNPKSQRNEPQKKEKKKIIKKVVKDDAGEEVVIEEEEDNRSWIQKNWLLLVTPLILYLLVTDDKK
ncbi:uncharacterized protein PRCAT00001076001 [Priceomyces carsonii]|uniref:uncharacterized protein n=1 Tax=Priceomyces carsonii TaxID=28549 RepID=UPI002ED89F02|nr:unnamed protein product [Priceomyces carsonii]